MTAYLSLGSNLGDRRANLMLALSELEKAGVEVRRVSSIYETEPVGHKDQGWFLNCAVEAGTDLEPLPLLHLLLGIERLLGRERTVPGGPRTLDLDILFYEDRVMDTAELALPHPRMAGRRFVLQPLAEIAPEARHPVTHRTVREMLGMLMDQSQVRLL